MGDLINKDIFKTLGFDSGNQWIFYDDRFENFFQLFAERITEHNILSENEVLEVNDLKFRGKFRENHEVNEIKNKLNDEYPGLFNVTDEHVYEIEKEANVEEKVYNMYSKLVDEMSKSNSDLNAEIIDLKVDYNELQRLEKKLTSECLDKATTIQEMQKTNKKLCDESIMCFTKMQSQPLFIHQLPLDQYFLKCDLFLQHLTLYLKENFKIQDFEEIKIIFKEDVTTQLEMNRKLYLYYSNKLITTKAKIMGTQSLIKNLDLNQIHIINLTNMKKECSDLEMLNHHFVSITYQTLLNDLEMHLVQKSKNRMELILYENTKEKLNRASQRLEKVKVLTKIVSDALTNAEVVWIVAQLDLEKIKNRFNNSHELQNEMLKCSKRIDLMGNVQIFSQSGCTLTDHFISKLSEILSNHTTSKINNTNSLETYIYEYIKFSNLVAAKFDSILKDNSKRQKFNEILRGLNQIEKIFSAYVYDSPVKQPLYEIIRFIGSISKAKANQHIIKQTIRTLRQQFKENINERMSTDKLWRYSQLLWIWFLTEPKRVLMAIEEVRKIASKLPTITGLKSLSGIKRM